MLDTGVRMAKLLTDWESRFRTKHPDFVEWFDDKVSSVLLIGLPLLGLALAIGAGAGLYAALRTGDGHSSWWADPLLFVVSALVGSVVTGFSIFGETHRKPNVHGIGNLNLLGKVMFLSGLMVATIQAGVHSFDAETRRREQAEARADGASLRERLVAISRGIQDEVGDAAAQAARVAREAAERDRVASSSFQQMATRPDGGVVPLPVLEAEINGAQTVVDHIDRTIGHRAGDGTVFRRIAGMEDTMGTVPPGDSLFLEERALRSVTESTQSVLGRSDVDASVAYEVATIEGHVGTPAAGESLTTQLRHVELMVGEHADPAQRRSLSERLDELSTDVGRPPSGSSSLAVEIRALRDELRGTPGNDSLRARIDLAVGATAANSTLAQNIQELHDLFLAHDSSANCALLAAQIAATCTCP